MPIKGDELTHNTKIIKENGHLKEIVTNSLTHHNKIIQRTLQIEYYTFLEHEKIIKTIDKSIDTMEDMIKSMKRIKEQTTNHHKEIQAKLTDIFSNIETEYPRNNL